MRIRRRRMNESKIGYDAMASAVEDCNSGPIMAIASIADDEIYFYDAGSKKYITQSELMRVGDDDESLWPDAVGEDFKVFAAHWNSMVNSDDPDIMKSKNCVQIQGNFNESSEDESGDGQLHIFKMNKQTYGLDYYIFILPNGDCYYCSETAPKGGESYYDGEMSYSTRAEMEDVLDATEFVNLNEVPSDILEIAKRLDK